MTIAFTPLYGDARPSTGERTPQVGVESRRLSPRFAYVCRWLNLGVSCSMLVMAVHMTVDWQNGLVVHGPKAAAMMAAQWIAFMWTSYMYIAGESKQKQTPPAVAT